MNVGNTADSQLPLLAQIRPRGARNSHCDLVRELRYESRQYAGVKLIHVRAMTLLLCDTG
jgi:hypothetical protein